MSILIYAEHSNGKFKKTTFEIASYAKRIGDQIGTSVTAVVINGGDTSALSIYGVSKVLKITDSKLSTFNAKAYADVLCQSASKEASKSNFPGSLITSGVFKNGSKLDTA